MVRVIRKLPLFAFILLGFVFGAGAGLILGPSAESLKLVADLILQALRLLATPLIFLGVVHAILATNVQGKMALKLAWFLFSNTAMAIFIGIGVALVLEPGRHIHLAAAASVKAPASKPIDDLIARIPKDLVNPFATNDVIGVILIGLAISIALRSLKSGEHAARIETLQGFVKLALDAVQRILHWVFTLIPVAVFAVVARVVGTSGVAGLAQMLWFIVAVVVGLTGVVATYLIRLHLRAHIRPIDYLRGGLDAFLLAFSTASSAVTLPVTYECATVKLRLREEVASLGIMVGGAFNHDGSALYQAMAAIFVAQGLGHPLSVEQIGIVAAMAFFASVAVAGIPEAGLVLMIAVFHSVHLPIEAIPLLLPLDWFLDRCRTAVNVAGDLAATCLADKPDRTPL